MTRINLWHYGRITRIQFDMFDYELCDIVVTLMILFWNISQSIWGYVTDLLHFTNHLQINPYQTSLDCLSNART